MLENNPLFTEVFKSDAVTLYCPSELHAYHKSRELAMQAQERYANAGISKEVLEALANQAIEIINRQNSKDTLRTDMAVLWNNLLARTKDPVDELCAIRMGAISCFLPNEDPNKVNDSFTNHKLELASKDPDLYSFFLSLGIELLPEYKAHLHTLTIADYLTARNQTLKGLRLQSTP